MEAGQTGWPVIGSLDRISDQGENCGEVKRLTPGFRTRRGLRELMIACTDVDYRAGEAVAGCVLFGDWQDAHSADEIVVRVQQVESYQPGHFFKRELPCLLEVLARVTCALEAVIVDGYVWLNEEQRPGLGAYLYRALMERIPVIGVAKTRFAQGAPSLPVCRGRSKRPLYVSAAGINLSEAAANIKAMHGPFRIPTLLGRVDRLCREG